jgi:transcriptional regulator with XRE-family HTH domain
LGNRNSAAAISAVRGATVNMASAELSVVYSDDGPDRPTRGVGQPGQALHRIQEVRRLQGMSLRTAARQLGTDIRSIRAQEQSSTDLRLSDLYKWQRALDVPVAELLSDEDEPLSRPIRERSSMLKIMKTARSLVESSQPGPAQRMAENLVEQLLELMPELKEVSPWHSVGQRRSLDEMGRIAEQPLGDPSYYSSDYE